jgi:hypothetical protein
VALHTLDSPRSIRASSTSFQQAPRPAGSRVMGKITPLGRYVIIRPCTDLMNENPRVKSVLCFGTAERIRNMCSLVHFRSADPFRDVLVPQGASCSSFVSYAAGMVANASTDSVFVGPCDPTGNSWFPQDYLSLAIPINMARRMADDLENSFINKRPDVAYPEQRSNA